MTKLFNHALRTLALGLGAAGLMAAAPAAAESANSAAMVPAVDMPAKYISIEHGASLQTRFAHLSDMVVSAGDKVKKGDLIGYVGSTGRSTGPHLHYEVRVDGVAVDPSPYMVASDDHRDHALALLSAE